MKKYILLGVMSVILLGTLIFGGVRIKQELRAADENYALAKQNCEKNKELQEKEEMYKEMCTELTETGVIKEDVETYYNDFDSLIAMPFDPIGEKLTFDESGNYFGGELILNILADLLMFVASICSILFVKDYLEKKKITKKNSKEVKANCVKIALISAIPFVLYAIGTTVLPFIVANKYISVSGDTVYTMVLHIVAYTLFAVVASFIGLISAFYGDKKWKNYLLAFILIFAVTFGLNTTLVFVTDLFPNIEIEYSGIFFGWFYHNIFQIVLTVLIALFVYLAFDARWNKKYSK